MIKLNKYSVLLQYPDKEETFFQFCQTHDPRAAITAARQAASVANHHTIEPDEFTLLAVFAGHHDILLGVYDE